MLLSDTYTPEGSSPAGRGQECSIAREGREGKPTDNLHQGKQEAKPHEEAASQQCRCLLTDELRREHRGLAPYDETWQVGKFKDFK